MFIFQILYAVSAGLKNTSPAFSDYTHFYTTAHKNSEFSNSNHQV